MESPFEAGSELKQKRTHAARMETGGDVEDGQDEGDETSYLKARKTDFKLRLPYTLNQSK